MVDTSEFPAPSADAAPAPRETPTPGSTGGIRVSGFFLRCLGFILLCAFASIAVQARLLMGSRGLLPIAPVIETLRAHAGARLFAEFPTIFWFGASDGAIVAAAWAGAALGVAMLAGLRSRLALAAAFVLFLSLVVAGRTFFTFQWDNLLLETSFLALLLPMPWLANLPRGRPQAPPAPFVRFLFRWLLFRIYFESGLSKLLPGAHGWTELTAMAHYFETAPLPTWIGWLAHQQPLAFARALTGLTLGLELGAPFLIFGPRRARHIAFVIFAAMQLTFFLTANYGYFNLLCAALSVWLLDDADLEALAARARVRLGPPAPRDPPRTRAWVVGAVGGLLLLASITEGVLFVARDREGLEIGWLDSFRKLYAPARIVNVYHLFASMTEQRIEVTIEGSADGGTWKPYYLRYKPGDPRRRPPFAAPHQPRVDFQLWFFTLSPGSPGNAYVEALLSRICHDPAAVKALWLVDPFPRHPPEQVRLGFDDYRMTDLATLRTTGRWWSVRRLGVSRAIACRELPR